MALVLPMQNDSEGNSGMMIVVGAGPQQNLNQLSPYLNSVAAEIAALFHFERIKDKEVYDAIVDERYRLAREIHDGIAQTLAFLKIQTAQMITYLTAGKMERLETVLSANYQTLTEAFQDARLAIENLRVTPGAVTRSWLINLAQDFTVATGIPVDVSDVTDGIELPLPVQAQLVRIIQEALNNVRKHSKATSVVITSRVEGDDMVFEVKDDGMGFESGQAGGDSKFGLIGMRERADMIDGDFQIRTRSGEGTTVRLVIPIRNNDSSTGV
jgi:two-component system nitrate/nitrite sensor histidine kinase NarX